MSKRVKARARASQAEMGQRTLREFEEVQRRLQLNRARSITEALSEAAPRFKDMGWRVTEEEKR